MSSPVDINTVPEDEQQSEISIKLAEYRPRRTQRYLAVNVLLLSWKDSDLDCAEEVNELGRMFEERFNYSVWPYLVPSEESQSKLTVLIAQFLSQFGGPDKLILVYYGGHGGPPVSTKSPCTWSALVTGGPTVDWSIIQPLFFGAECDVVIFLDCCYAGQAARARASHNIEFLAATDKDQWTPIGQRSWPSFTRVLMDNMIKTLNDDAVVTIPGLHSRLVESKAGLARQPFYVALSGDNSAGTVQLRRWEDVRTTTAGKSQTVPQRSLGETTSLYLRLSTFRPIDAIGREALVKWMTRDSPSSIEDIELVEKVFAEAKHVNDLGLELIQPNSLPGSLLTFLSDQGREEALRLFRALQETLSPPGPWQLTDREAVNIINNVKQKSGELIALIEDCLTSLNTSSLRDCGSRDIFRLRDLRSRIAMRLALLQDEVTPIRRRPDFDDQGQGGQRFRIGKEGKDPVLVEYWYYTYTDEEAFSKTTKQVAKISALHAEPKIPGFHSLLGMGFLHESLYGRRFGFIYRFPDNRIGQRPHILSSLISQVKIVPLEIRNRLASALCEALLHFHSIGWLHKGIKSDNVIIFSQSGVSDSQEPSVYATYEFQNPYFIGFDCSRPSDAETWSAVDFTIKDNIYRHPERWGIPKRFERHHDLYALGVLLLEIGCWRILPSMDSKRANFETIKDPRVLQDFFLNTACVRLAHAAGTKYADAVRVCLGGLKSSDYEDWQFQRLVREKVWNPLREGC